MDIALGRMMVGPEQVRITGTTDGFDSVDRIKSRLEAASRFRAVNIDSATVDKSGGRVRFRMNIDL